MSNDPKKDNPLCVYRGLYSQVCIVTYMVLIPQQIFVTAISGCDVRPKISIVNFTHDKTKSVVSCERNRDSV